MIDMNDHPTVVAALKEVERNAKFITANAGLPSRMGGEVAALRATIKSLHKLACVYAIHNSPPDFSEHVETLHAMACERLDVFRLKQLASAQGA